MKYTVIIKYINILIKRSVSWIKRFESLTPIVILKIIAIKLETKDENVKFENSTQWFFMFNSINKTLEGYFLYEVQSLKIFSII